MELAKDATVYGWAAMAANIRKGARFLTLYGLPDLSLCRIGASEIWETTQNGTDLAVKQVLMIKNQAFSSRKRTG